MFSASFTDGVKALDPNEAHSNVIAETLDGDSDCLSVKIQTKTWADTFNIFNGNFQSRSGQRKASTTSSLKLSYFRYSSGREPKHIMCDTKCVKDT